MPIIKIPTAEEYDLPILKNADKLVKTTGLVDLQVNGFGGVDFNKPGITQDSLEYSLEKMLASGVTTCLPTIITGSETHLLNCLYDLETLRNSSDLAKTMIAGYHLEGPFLFSTTRLFRPSFCKSHGWRESGNVFTFAGSRWRKYKLGDTCTGSRRRTKIY